MKRGRFLQYAVLACGFLAVAPSFSQTEGARSRTLFTPGASKAKDLIVTLDPVQKPPAGGEVSVYLPVQFALDSATLSVTAKRNLAIIAEALSAPELQHVAFVVEGHTDASGAAAYNESLSLRRANSAVRYLVSMGVQPARLVVSGRGEADLLPGVHQLAAEQRRVEFVRRFWQQGG